MNNLKKTAMFAVVFATTGFSINLVQAAAVAHAPAATHAAPAAQSTLDPVMDGGSPINFTKGMGYAIDIADPKFLKNQATISFQLDTLTENGKTTYESKFNVTSKPAHNLAVDGDNKTLLQLHFHAPGEHKVEGETFPLEVHYVHNNKAGNLTVVGVLFREGKENLAIKKLINQVRKGQAKKGKAVPFKFSLDSMRPKDTRMHRYHGSLTAHSFAKNVQWLVFQQTLEVSKAQLQQMQELHMVNGAREIQPLGARAVVRDTLIDGGRKP
jgi:carbonic anhydrase